MFFEFIAYKNKREEKKISTRGFSLLEMIVAVSIFIILTTAMLFRYNTFNQRTNLDTLAHQIAQWIRNAQVEGLSVKQSSPGSNKYPSYGVHFALSSPDRFIYFADLNHNNIYDDTASCGGATDECQKEIRLLQGSKIVSLCGESSTVVSTAECASPLGASGVFDVLFIPPDTDAVISGDLNGSSFPTTYTMARITIVSALPDYQRSVDVWSTGQVSVR